MVEFKYLLLYDEVQTLEQVLATGASCDGKTEQRLINARKNVLGCIDLAHLKAVEFSYCVRKSYSGNFAFLFFSADKPYPRRRLLQFLRPSTSPAVRHWSSFAGASLSVRRRLKADLAD